MFIPTKPPEREENDFYATDPSAIAPLLKLMGWEHGGLVIRENSCGQGHLVMPLMMAGHTVIASDLIHRGCGIGGVDYLKPNWLDDIPVQAVVMNPPFKHALKFIQKALMQAPVVCAFLRITFLESTAREQFFREYPPRYVAVFVKRVKSAKNADWADVKNGSPVCYAWFIWQVGYKGPTEVKWI